MMSFIKINFRINIISTIVFLFISSHLFAINEVDSLLKISKSESNQNVLALNYYKIATYYTNHAEYAKSEEYLNKSFQIYNTLKDEYQIMQCYIQYGIMESFRGNYPRSANFFLRALLYADKKNDTSIHYAVYINLASVYSALEDYKKAKYYLNKIDKKDLSRDFNLQINYLGNMGQIEYELGNYTSALTYLEKGISFFDIHNPDITLIQLLILTGDCATKLNEIDKAIKYYDIAFKLSEKGDFPVQEAHLYFGYAVAKKKSNPKLSLNLADSSLALAKKYEVLDLIANIYKLKSEVYQSLNLSDSALKNYKLYDRAIDSVFSMDSKQNIELLEANYEVEKSKNYIEKLTLTNQKNNLQKFIYILSTISTLIIIIVLIYWLRKRNILNKKLNNSNRVKDKLLSIIAHDLKSPLHNISSVLSEIENTTFTKEEQSKIILSLTTQTDITVETLENLLKWGQAQLKGISINQVVLEVKPEIERSVELFRAQLISKNIRINIELPDELRILFDKDHFDFIIRNLIGNAIKFSYNNSQIFVRHEMSRNDKVKLIVQDFGTGIAKQDIETIFQPSPNIRLGTNNEKGSGLGLALCREFAEANKSTLSLFSEPKKGSMFYFFCNIAN